MPNILPTFLFACGFFFFGAVIRLLMKNKISEKISLVWLAGSFVIFILSGNLKLLDRIAAAVGIHYAPSLLFLLSTLILLFIVLYMSIQISILNDKMKELGQYIALQNYEEARPRSGSDHSLQAPEGGKNQR